MGFWQGAFREPSDPNFAIATEAITERRMMTIDLLYGDHEGGQRTISRFALIPAGEDQWLAIGVTALEPRQSRPALATYVASTPQHNA